MKFIKESPYTIYSDRKGNRNPNLAWLWQGEDTPCRHVYIHPRTVQNDYELVFTQSSDPDNVVISRRVAWRGKVEDIPIFSVHTTVPIAALREFMACRLTLKNLWLSSVDAYIAITGESPYHWYECSYEEIAHLVER